MNVSGDQARIPTQITGHLSMSNVILFFLTVAVDLK